MCKTSKTILISLMISCSVLTAPGDDQGTLEMVIELWRHGARAPQTNTLKNSYADSVGPSNLTPNGMRQQYNLGRKVRDLYLSSDIFADPQKAYIYSSQTQRTIGSAYSHALGLFPSTGAQPPTVDPNAGKALIPPIQGGTDYLKGKTGPLPQNLNFVPIQIIPKDQDLLFMKSFKQACPFAASQMKVMQTQKGTAMMSTFKDVISKIPLDFLTRIKSNSGIKGIKNDSPLNPNQWNYNTLKTFLSENKFYNSQFGKPMKGLEKINDKLKSMAALIPIYKKFVTPMMQKFYSHQMATEILDKIEQKTIQKGPSKDLKYVGYSGHDGNVIPFLLGYGLLSEECLKNKIGSQNAASSGPTSSSSSPPPSKSSGSSSSSPPPGSSASAKSSPTSCMASDLASTFIWEVRKLRTQYFVKSSFNGQNVDANLCSQEKTANGCPLKTFKSKFKDQLVLESEKDFWTMCKGDGDFDPNSVGKNGRMMSRNQGNIFWKMTSLIFGLLTFTLVGAVTYLMQSKRVN